MSYAIECINISKNFGKTKALIDVNFRMEADKIYGLLGRNGAGKSTLLSIIAAQIFPTKGQIKVLNEKPYENGGILNNICLIKETGTFLKDLKVKETIYLASLFYPNWDNNFAKNILYEFGLNENKTFKNLSLGMKSQLSIVIGLSSRAPITIFDEPYIGLDAPGRQFFYDILMEDYMQNPRTIIISTHLIDEISNLLEEIIILHNGSIKTEGNIDDIRNKAYYISGEKNEVLKYIAGKNILIKNEIGDNSVAAILDEFSEKEKRAIEASGLNISPISLQQLFIYLTAGKMTKRGGKYE